MQQGDRGIYTRATVVKCKVVLSSNGGSEYLHHHAETSTVEMLPSTSAKLRPTSTLSRRLLYDYLYLFSLIVGSLDLFYRYSKPKNPLSTLYLNPSQKSQSRSQENETTPPHPRIHTHQPRRHTHIPKRQRPGLPLLHNNKHLPSHLPPHPIIHVNNPSLPNPFLPGCTSLHPPFNPARHSIPRHPPTHTRAYADHPASSRVKAA